MKADNAIGKWNRFIITMQGDRLTVELNGITVIEKATLPGVPKMGPIGLQHRGSPINLQVYMSKNFEPLGLKITGLVGACYPPASLPCL
jgi:hypothetical protein